MKSLLIKSHLFGDIVIPANDFEESRDIWDGLGKGLVINVFGKDDIQANIFPVKDGLLCTSDGTEDMCLEVVVDVKLINTNKQKKC
jgi:hypothetical protein